MTQQTSQSVTVRFIVGLMLLIVIKWLEINYLVWISDNIIDYWSKTDGLDDPEGEASMETIRARLGFRDKPEPVRLRRRRPELHSNAVDEGEPRDHDS